MQHLSSKQASPSLAAGLWRIVGCLTPEQTQRLTREIELLAAATASERPRGGSRSRVPEGVVPTRAVGDRDVCGVRHGELRALQARDVDLDRRRIHAQRGWDPYKGEIDPKSEKGTRPTTDGLRASKGPEAMWGCGARSRFLALRSRTATVFKTARWPGANTGARDTYFGSSKPKKRYHVQDLEIQTSRKSHPLPAPGFLAFLSRFQHR